MKIASIIYLSLFIFSSQAIAEPTIQASGVNCEYRLPGVSGTVKLQISSHGAHEVYLGEGWTATLLRPFLKEPVANVAYSPTALKDEFPVIFGSDGYLNVQVGKLVDGNTLITPIRFASLVGVYVTFEKPGQQYVVHGNYLAPARFSTHGKDTNQVAITCEPLSKRSDKVWSKEMYNPEFHN